MTSDNTVLGTLKSIGSSVGDHYYSLVVVQPPVRGRMCGLGNRDRRSLAPVAIVKLVLTTLRNNDPPPDIEEIQSDFLVVTADLWSEDGTEDKNYIVGRTHPGVRGPPSTDYPLRSATEGPYPYTESPALFPSQPRSYSYPGSADYSLPQQGVSDLSSNLTYAAQFGATDSSSVPQTPSGWQPPDAQYTLPSISSFITPEHPGYRSQSPPRMPLHQVYSPYPHRVTSDARNPAGAAGSSYVQTTGGDLYLAQDNLRFSPSEIGPLDPLLAPSHGHSSASFDGSRQSRALVRNLVGHVAANAAKLVDHNGEAGIFFIFPDLSVRAEGLFRLRFRLMDIGTPDATGAGTNMVSPVIAETFSDGFQVWNPKLYPGVGDIALTPLSLAFISQGQKIPLVREADTLRL
ncbi:hypothetical protein BOTBODRAFT_556384 [Botryobasidium botryosum FD-172 SS1]|uniref:Velvet domain-containing protein n=1 Tax=Botryobasidium botryosum (strain FD-172 SS1) TaxID=930990 RepID=A0A067M032_BOTB1|nr:hypothetical protein BOTBODRAFT_556384 [Botryobasidium botryosum FD-172 SS1]